MHALVRAVASLAIGALVTGCGGDGSGAGTSPGGGGPAASGEEVALAEGGGEVLAKVGQTGGVTEADFAEAAARTPPANGQELSPEERRKVLDELVVEEALFQEAAKRGLHRDPKVRKIMINLLMREEVFSNVSAADFSPEELRAYFDAHREEFVVPEKVQVKRIFLRVGPERSLAQAMTQAKQLRDQVAANPGTFKDVAIEHSEDPYKRRGGDLGYLSPEGKPGVDPLVVQKAFALPVGEVSEPFEAGGGVNIVYVPKKRERVERTFEQMKGSVLRKLKNERYKELTDAYIDSVRARYPVAVDEKALEKAPTTPVRGRTFEAPGGEEADLEDHEDHGQEDELE